MICGFIIDAFMYSKHRLCLALRMIDHRKSIIYIKDYYPSFLIENTETNMFYLAQALHSEEIYESKLEKDSYSINACEVNSFIKIICKTKADLLRLKKHFDIKKISIYNYEDNLEYQFFNQNKLDPSIIICIQDYKILSISDNKVISYEVLSSDISNVTAEKHDLFFPNLIIPIIGYDIEVMCHVEGGFPVKEEKLDKIICISYCKTTLNNLNKDKYFIAYLGNKKVLTVDELEFYGIDNQFNFKAESELLIHIVKQMESCDIIFDFNGTNFDLPFILYRLETHFNYKLIKSFPMMLSFFKNKVSFSGFIHFDLLCTFKNRDSDKNKENNLNYLCAKYLRTEIISINTNIITCKYVQVTQGMNCDITFNSFEEINYYNLDLQVIKIEYLENDILNLHCDKNIIIENKDSNKLFVSIIKNNVELSDFYKYNDDINIMKKVLGYCVNDTRLTKYLINKQNFLTTYILKAKLRSIILRDSISKGNSYLNQAMITKSLLNNNWAIKNKHVDINSVIDKYEGATVLTPCAGKYFNVFVMDFNSLYPSIIIAYNICQTTLITHDLKEKYNILDDNLFHIEVEGTDLYFLKPHIKKGLVPSFCESFINSRADIKKLLNDITLSIIEQNILNIKQLNLKVSNNSIYGSIGDNNSIHYNKYLAASIPAYGRIHLNMLKEYVEQNNYKIIGGDTDSVFVVSLDNTKTVQEIELHLDQLLELYNSTLPSAMKIETEKIYKILFLGTKKKRRFGIIGNKYEIKGFLSVKRDTPIIIKNMEQKIFNILINSDDYLFDIKSYISDTIDNIHNFPLEHFAITKTLKDEHEYKDSNTPHLFLAKKLQKYGITFKGGDKIIYIFVSELASNPQVKDKIATLDQIKSMKYTVDFNKYKDDIFSMIRQILEDIISDEELFFIQRIIFD